MKTVLDTCARQLKEQISEIDYLRIKLREQAREREVKEAPMHPLALAEAVTDYDPETIDLSCPNPEAN